MTPPRSRSARLPGPDSLSSLRSGGSAIADQILSSGTQLLLVVLVAHRSSAAVLGAVSIGVLVHGLFLGAVRALVGDVTLIRCRNVVPERAEPGAREARSPEAAEQARLGLSLALAFGLVTALGLSVAALLLGGSVGHVLLLFALAAPVVHGQDLLRSVAYGSRRINDATLLDGVWVVVQVVASAVLFATDRATATSLLLAWVGAATCSLLVGWVIGRYLPSTRGIRAWIAEDGRRGLGYLGDFLVSTGIVQASFLALGAILPLDEFGAFRLAFLAISPLANLMAGVRSLTLARLAGTKGDRDEALHRARRMGPTFAGAAAAYGLVVSLLPGSIGEAAFGQVWSDARGLVAVVALGEVFRLSAFPAIDFVKVYGSPGLLVRTRVTTSVVLVLGILVGGVASGPRGAVWGTAAALLISAALWWRCAERQAGLGAA